MVHLSNALGTINPVRRISDAARARGIPVLVDGAQSASHLPVDVRELGCDFFVCSGHKLFGPTGIGVLYGREALLERMPPWQGGGDMISSVTFERSSWAGLPAKFEAGTPHIAGVIGLGAAIDWLSTWASRQSRRTSTTCSSMPPRRCRSCRGCASSGPPASGPAS